MSDNNKNLDSIFEALAHQHRRDIIYRLSLQPHSISQLAAMQHLSLPAIYKHIKILKSAGIVQDKKIGRIHFLALQRKSLYGLQKWVMQYSPFWGSDTETLENYKNYLKKKTIKKKSS